jgi:hypothetical protein
LSNKTSEKIDIESWLIGQLKASKAFLEKCYCGTLFWEDLSFYLVDTKRGKEAYFKTTGFLPATEPSEHWRSEYGNVETHDGQHFIFLDPTLVKNRAETDVQNALTHQILRALHPYSSEKEIKHLEEELCDASKDPVQILEHLSPPDNADNQNVLIKIQAKKKS